MLNAQFPHTYPFHLETIIISDGEGGTLSQVDTSGSETECELPLPRRIAKRQRGMSSVSPLIVHVLIQNSHPVRGPGCADENKNIDLTASVSSLCLEEAPSLVGPSTTTSAVILDAWSTMRKASAPFVVDNDVAETSLEF
jgi:hypothetical protein